MNNYFIKTGIGYIIADIFIKALSLISTPIFTRVLAKDEYGNVINFTVWYGVVIIIATLSMHATLNRARYDFKDNINGYIASLLILGNFITIILFGICFIFKNYVIYITGMKWKYVIFIFICIFFNPAFSFYQAEKKMRYDYKLIILIGVLIPILNIIMSLAMITIDINGEIAYIIGMQFPTLIISIILYINYIKKGKNIDLKMCKYALQISLPYIPHLLSLNLLIYMDRIIIKYYCGAENAAIYAVAYSTSLVITVLSNAINQVVSPWLGEKLFKKEYSIIRKKIKFPIVFFSFSSICFMLIAPELLWILGGNSYYSSRFILAPLVMAYMCQFIYTLYVNIEQYEKKTFAMAIASVVAMLVNGILNLYFIPIYGYFIAAYTTLFSYLLLLIMHMFLVKRIGLIKVYDSRFIFLILCISFLSMNFIMYLYSFTFILRYILLLFFITICVLITIKLSDIKCGL